MPVKEVVDYYAPYASEFKHTGINSDYLLSGLSDEKRMEIGPSLLYYHSTFSNKQESNKKCFRYISLDLAQLSENMAEVLLAINADIRKFDNIRYSLCDILRNGALEKYVPAEILDEETWKLLYEIDKRATILQQKGVCEHILKQLVTQPKVISRMVVTRDYRILLSDYNNMEITMTPLVKAVYLLFLRHPEGIIFKHLGDYRSELQHIYERIKGEPATEKMLQSINDATDPYKNSINEKVARIREAFITRFDERLATNYIVHGERGEAKYIPLDVDLITYE